MTITPTRTLNNNVRTLSSICVLAAAVSACGGGSSGTGDVEEDTDTQGIFGSTTDTDNDGLTDDFEDTIGTDPNSFDSDGDGLSDGEEFDEFFTNPLEADSDGDGTNDGDEVAAFTDPIDPSVGGSGVTGTDDTGTGTGNAGTDPSLCDDLNSTNDSWADNCQLQRFGVFADSSYTRGVQRILWCQNNNNEQAVDILTFADGELGPGTEASIEAYQAANPPLAVDGVVGPQTWLSLRDELNIVTATLNGFDSYSVSGCGVSIAQFFQEVQTTQTSTGQSVTDLLGWTLAEVPGSNVMVDFGSEF